MENFRHFLNDHRRLAALIVAASLWLKLLVPAGFMPVFAGGAVYVELCSGQGVETMAMSGMAHGHDRHDASGKDDQPCGFAGHAPAAMAGADPILLLLAVAFIVATVFRMPFVQRAPRRGFLRPPLRGPPAIA